MGVNKGQRNNGPQVNCSRGAKKAYHARKAVCPQRGFGMTDNRDAFHPAQPRQD